MNYEPRVVVLGSGTLATALEKRWRSAGVPVARAGKNFGRWHADLARGPDCWCLPARPDWVFVCAGVTSREKCERDPWRSRWVNVVGGIRVARHFERRGARVVFFGTDLPPENGMYARQKEELRRAVASMPHCLWIRLGKVIYPELPVFAQWREDLARGRPLRVFAGVSIFPLSPEAVAECGWQLTRPAFPVAREASWLSNLSLDYLTLAKRWKAKFFEKKPNIIRKNRKNLKKSWQPQRWAEVVFQHDQTKWWWGPNKN